MNKKRIEKMMAHTLGQYISQEIPLADHGVLITITEVSVTPSLELAKIYISLLGKEGLDKEKFLQTQMQEHAWRMRFYLTKKLRNILRSTPKELRFYIDNKQEVAAQIQETIEKHIT